MGGAAGGRDRPSEFFERSPMPKAELLGRLDEAVAQARATLAEVAPDQLGQLCRIQGFNDTIVPD